MLNCLTCWPPLALIHPMCHCSTRNFLSMKSGGGEWNASAHLNPRKRHCANAMLELGGGWSILEQRTRSRICSPAGTENQSFHFDDVRASQMWRGNPPIRRAARRFLSREGLEFPFLLGGGGGFWGGWRHNKYYFFRGMRGRWGRTLVSKFGNEVILLCAPTQAQSISKGTWNLHPRLLEMRAKRPE